MNKKELIDKIESLPSLTSITSIRPYVDKKIVLGLISQLDEPQKVKVPQCVGDYIEHAKESEWDLEDLFEFVGDQECGGIQKWFYDECNQDTLALAWINGYTIEKNKRYIVKIIGITDYNSYLNYRKAEKAWTIESKMEIDAIRTNHTYEQLEQAGFGWVFDCPGIEVEEVEE